MLAVSNSRLQLSSKAVLDAITFYNRVIADGGTVPDFSLVQADILELKRQCVYQDISLLTTASGRKARKQYSILPTDGSGDLSVTRSGDTAMELNANGFWQPVAANVPRYDYVGGRPMINVEELRTNLLARYKSFPHSDWTKSGVTIDDNGGSGYASPFVDANGANLMSGYKLVATANNGYMRLATAVTVTAATTYTNSIWIKRVTGAGQAYIIDTNTTDRAITLTTEWQRFTYSAAAGSTSGQIGVKLAVAGDEVLIAHAQLEAGATASSPIGGAEGSAQSRNADVIASAVDYSNIKTLVINNDAYVVETALPNNGYTLPQLDINKLAMFTNTLTDEQITANGWTKKVLAFAVSVDIAAGTTVSIEVDGVGTIGWGDGTSDSYSSLVNKTHVYTGGYKGLILFTGTLTFFNSSSNANWYFNIKDAPANLTTLRIAGSNTITGNIANAPANLTYLNIEGSNTITGNIADTPANLTTLQVTGLNTITGNIADTPANMTYLFITGSNTITGNIADTPANLTTLFITGSNTITGNIADAPANLTFLFITGSNTLADYTAGRVWKTNYNYLYLRQAAGAGLSSTEVDSLLIDLAATTWGGSYRTLDIGGVNAARTSASDAAVLSLQAQSVTVITN